MSAFFFISTIVFVATLQVHALSSVAAPGASQPCFSGLVPCGDGWGACVPLRKKRLSLDPAVLPSQEERGVDRGINSYRNQDSSVAKSTN